MSPKIRLKLVAQGADITMVDAGRVPVFYPTDIDSLIRYTGYAANFLKGGAPAVRLVFTGEKSFYKPTGELDYTAGAVSKFEQTAGAIHKTVREVIDAACDRGEFYQITSEKPAPEDSSATVWLVVRISVKTILPTTDESKVEGEGESALVERVRAELLSNQMNELQIRLMSVRSRYEDGVTGVGEYIEQIDSFTDDVMVLLPDLVKAVSEQLLTPAATDGVITPNQKPVDLKACRRVVELLEADLAAATMALDSADSRLFGPNRIGVEQGIVDDFKTAVRNIDVAKQRLKGLTLALPKRPKTKKMRLEEMRRGNKIINVPGRAEGDIWMVFPHYVERNGIMANIVKIEGQDTGESGTLHSRLLYNVVVEE